MVSGAREATDAPKSRGSNGLRGNEDILETVLVFVSLFTANDRTPEGLVLLALGDHQRRHVLEEHVGVCARRQLAEVQIHRRQLLL